MVTSHPTCFTDSQFVQIWNRDATPEVLAGYQAHLDACNTCRQRWEEFSQKANWLSNRMAVNRQQSERKTAGPCPDPERLAEYTSGVLSATDAQAVEQHLQHCFMCASQVCDVLLDVWEEEHSSSNAEVRTTAASVLWLVSHMPQSPHWVRSLTSKAPRRLMHFRENIQLPVMMPHAQRAQRLAAASGDGFSEQVIRQTDPPVTIHLTQFGQELRITVRVEPSVSAYTHCLAELKFLEGDLCRLTRVVLIEDGRGRCLIDPDSVLAALPQQQPFQVTLDPILTLEDLETAGTSAFIPILEKLVMQPQPEIRGIAIKLLGQTTDPVARALLQRLSQDPDSQLATWARQALQAKPRPEPKP